LTVSHSLYLLCLQGGFGNKNVRVCMVDTGFDYYHPDLAPNLWRNPGEISNNGKDDDNNGVLPGCVVGI
jgi:subtilisin family serine protease